MEYSLSPTLLGPFPFVHSYLLLGAAVGLYTSPLSSMLWMPGASIHVLLVNSAVLLFLCSSLPIVVWTLGGLLTREWGITADRGLDARWVAD